MRSENLPADLETLKGLKMDDKTIEEKVIEQVGIIGEKIELSFYEKIEAGSVVAYIHPGNRLATLVGFNKEAGIAGWQRHCHAGCRHGPCCR